jgi:hypothetical protein
MGSFVQLVPAKPTHVGPIANRMRADDVREAAAFGRTPKSALRLGIRASVDCYTVMIDGKPEGIMGLFPANALEREGRPWMLGTEELYGHPRAWLKLMPLMVARWQQSCRFLSNYVAKDNVRAIRLLKKCGFVLGEGPSFGGVEFLLFQLGREDKSFGV